MYSRSVKTIFLLFVIFYFIGETELSRSCTKGKRKYGCQIENQKCMCGFGCNVNFPYRFRNKCEEALTKIQALNYVNSEEMSDPCQPSPCLNYGVCLQHHNKNFTCQCAGTGYYGKLCSHVCPSSLQAEIYTQEMAACIIV